MIHEYAELHAGQFDTKYDYIGGIQTVQEDIMSYCKRRKIVIYQEILNVSKLHVCTISQSATKLFIIHQGPLEEFTIVVCFHTKIPTELIFVHDAPRLIASELT